MNISKIEIKGENHQKKISKISKIGIDLVKIFKTFFFSDLIKIIIHKSFSNQVTT